MDPIRFDHLARLLGRASGRRALLSSLLGAALGGAAAAAARKRSNGKTHDTLEKDESRQSRQQVQAERRGKGRGRRTRKKRGRGNDGSQTEPTPGDCCGTKSCAPPEPGSPRSGCNYAGRFFAAHDFNGSIFRGIDGRGADFTAADLHGAVFAEACLHGASFRSARLGGSTWGDACLFGADFTGADLSGDSAVFAGARFCGTTMPDGSINDRDCGRETACCRREAQPGPTCQDAGDCADQECQTKTCQDGQCVYATVNDGPSPNPLCAGRCCRGNCCPANATECNALGLCCVPNCDDRDCGEDGCGGSCGQCSAGQICNEAGGRCLCTRQTCPGGCCANGPGNPGACRPGNANGACGAGGGQCAQCTAQQACVDGTCVAVACSGSCSNDDDCPNVRNCVCNLAEGACCTRSCAGKVCGPDGCGGLCGDGCPDGTVCSADGSACLCTAQSCPNGCCANGPGQAGECEPGDSGQACGTGGAPCAKCGAGSRCQNQRCTCKPDCGNKECGPDGCGGSCGTCASGQVCDEDDGECLCTRQTCPNGCCTNGSGKPGECRPGTTIQACGTGGQECEACDADDEICRGGRCVECEDICPDGCCAADGRCQPGDTIQACGAGGKACAQCTSQELCADGECVPSTCAGRCTQDTDCPDLRNCVCNQAQQTCCARNCAGKVCGSDGCGGTCENLCPPNTVCNADGTACLCTAQSCPNGCCSNGLGSPGTCEAGNTNDACGRPGESCQTCTGQEQCENRQCVCFPLTCDDRDINCGTFSDGCGRTLECGTCPDLDFPSCFVGVCVPCTFACKNGEDCINLANGDTICSAPGDINCGEPCSSNANCTDSDYPICIASITNGARSNPPNQTTTVAALCQGVPAACGALD